LGPGRMRVPLTASMPTATKMRNVAPVLGLSLFVVLFASASAAVYDRFGINDGDIANYRHMAAGIRSCALASSLVPDYLHPPANRTLLAHDAALHGDCRSELKHRHAPLGVMRVTDLNRSMICLSLAMVAPGEGDIAACRLPNSLPNPRR